MQTIKRNIGKTNRIKTFVGLLDKNESKGKQIGKRLKSRGATVGCRLVPVIQRCRLQVYSVFSQQSSSNTKSRTSSVGNSEWCGQCVCDCYRPTGIHSFLIKSAETSKGHSPYIHFSKFNGHSSQRLIDRSECVRSYAWRPQQTHTCEYNYRVYKAKANNRCK